MKLIYFILLSGIFFLPACNNNKNKVHYEYEVPDSVAEAEPLITPAVNIQDSLIYEDGKGEIMEFQYEGTLPAADGPGIQYELDVWKQENNNEGVFWLSTTYLASGDEEDHTYITEGRFEIHNRLHDGTNESIYELKPLDGSSSLYFFQDGDNLTMLDQQGYHISSISNHNYTLLRKK